MKRTLLSALIGLALASAGANTRAQVTTQSNPSSQSSQSQQGNEPQQLQTITVTGSAIPRIDVETP
ncbi:hypothetical protein [Oleiagrimonas sp. C23AA]|uniref:hypothetical protein n=1 Tax=Oleiagrimonas sp. C23AA TaxID=2719047 RepID=UPI00142194BE|nr:hypothetical protein [Oleiagrimonas sp. C23AA]NII11074.1 hypothetical protein [Oleiagrimonas sp. C23AA]